MDDERHNKPIIIHSGNGLAVAAFIIALVSFILVLMLGMRVFFYNHSVTHQSPAVPTIAEFKRTGPIALPDTTMSAADVAMYEAVAGKIRKKKAKIDEARVMLKIIWAACQDYYAECGHYPATVSDIFDWMEDGSDNIPSGLVLEAPPGEPRFIYYLDPNGMAHAESNTSVDPSLGDVSNVCIDMDGNVTGGTF